MNTMRFVNNLAPGTYNNNHLTGVPTANPFGMPIFGQNAAPVSSIHMGFSTANQNGCGWISTYNAMYLLGNAQTSSSIISYLENDGGMVFGGMMGTNPESIANYFSDMGVHANLTYDFFMGIDGMMQNSGSNVFVLLYSHQNGAHYIAVEYKDGKYYLRK
jgi:hypothetical protein